MAEVLDAREKKMVELSRENIDLQEANSILRRYGVLVWDIWRLKEILY